MCVSPKTFKDNNGQLLTVPCGHCYQCVRKRKLEWEIRITSEMSVSDCSFFSLISYNEENLPNPPIADKLALQMLIRRLRRFLEYRYGRHVKLKYFIVSEYGEERNRLHYHAIFFIKGIYFDRFQWKILLEPEWKKVFCSAYMLAPNWIHYCVKYMQKSYNMMLASHLGCDAYYKYVKERYKVDSLNGKLLIPFVQDGNIPEFEDFLNIKLPLFYMKGKGYPLPRSWYDKLFSNRYVVNYANKAKAFTTYKTEQQLFDEYKKQANFLYQNPDCEEKPKEYYDPTKGIELDKTF